MKKLLGIIIFISIFPLCYIIGGTLGSIATRLIFDIDPTLRVDKYY